MQISHQLSFQKDKVKVDHLVTFHLQFIILFGVIFSWGYLWLYQQDFFQGFVLLPFHDHLFPYMYWYIGHCYIYQLNSIESNHHFISWLSNNFSPIKWYNDCFLLFLGFQRSYYFQWFWMINQICQLSKLKEQILLHSNDNECKLFVSTNLLSFSGFVHLLVFLFARPFFGPFELWNISFLNCGLQYHDLVRNVNFL